jgi:hypothetical protein
MDYGRWCGGKIPDQQLLEILSIAAMCLNPDKPCELNDTSKSTSPGQCATSGEWRYSDGVPGEFPTVSAAFGTTRNTSFLSFDLFSNKD